MVAQAIREGIVVCVAAGNDSIDAGRVSLAHVEEAITVGAYGQVVSLFRSQHRFAWFSNYGEVVDVLAPVVDVLSTSPTENSLEVLSGTSMAAPHVAGAAALYLSTHPQATPVEVRDALAETARPRINDAPQGTTNRGLYMAGS